MVCLCDISVVLFFPDTHAALVTCPAVVGVEKVNVLNFAFALRYKNLNLFLLLLYVPGMMAASHLSLSVSLAVMP